MVASVYAGTSVALSVVSGRVSYTLGLTGPCLSLDTACSSSLVALHLAASALILDGSSCAAAAGIGLLVSGVTRTFSAAGMLSLLGRCVTFDSCADGYCRGEGSSTFVLNAVDPDPLVLAQSDSDVLISIDGSAVQQDGLSASLTAPNGASQRRLIGTVSSTRDSGDAAKTCLEAHGTGTALGDPIEVWFR